MGGQEESFSGVSHDDYLRDTISHKCLLPCTALSVVKIIEACPGCFDFQKPVGRKLEGKIITVINRSEIVGRPVAAMLANDGAVVYSIDVNSIYTFRDGRLHVCHDETPESCVRKVRKEKRTKHKMFSDCQLSSGYCFPLLYWSTIFLTRYNSNLVMMYLVH